MGNVGPMLTAGNAQEGCVTHPLGQGRGAGDSATDHGWLTVTARVQATVQVTATAWPAPSVIQA
jgi:hypothetical protein